MAGKAEIAALLLGGYLLGRTKRMRLVLTLAAAAEGGRLSSGTGGVAAQLTKTLASSPEAKALVQQLTGQLPTAAKAAAVAGATRGVRGLSERLQDHATGPQESDQPETERDNATPVVEQDVHGSSAGDGEPVDEQETSADDGPTVEQEEADDLPPDEPEEALEDPQQDPGGGDQEPEQHEPVDEDHQHEEAREAEQQAARTASPILVRPATQESELDPLADRPEGAFGEPRTRRSGDRLPAPRRRAPRPESAEHGSGSGGAPKRRPRPQSGGTTGAQTGARRSGERAPVRATSSEAGRPARTDPADRSDVEAAVARLMRDTPPTD